MWLDHANQPLRDNNLINTLHEPLDNTRADPEDARAEVQRGLVDC